MDWYDKLMTFLGPCISLTAIPHLIQMRTEQSAQGQSIWGPVLMLIFCSLWAFYGYRHKDVPILLTNWVGFLVYIVYLSFILYYQAI